MPGAPPVNLARSPSQPAAEQSTRTYSCGAPILPVYGGVLCRVGVLPCGAAACPLTSTSFIGGASDAHREKRDDDERDATKYDAACDEDCVFVPCCMIPFLLGVISDALKHHTRRRPAAHACSHLSAVETPRLTPCRPYPFRTMSPRST